MTQASPRKEPELFGPNDPTPAESQKAAKAAKASKPTKAKNTTKKTEPEKEAEPPPKKNEVAVHKPGAQAPAKAQPQALTLLGVMREVARDPRADVAKFREIMALMREEEARQAEREATQALSVLQAKLPRIARDRESDKHKYASLERISTAIDPMVAEAGFTISYGMADSPITDHYRVTARLAHIGGWARDYFIDLPSDAKGARGGDNKTGVQGIGSTIAYARRYLKLMIFDITIAGEDIDGKKAVKTITPAQIETLIELCATKRVSAQTFKDTFGFDIKYTPAAQFESIKHRIEQKRTAEDQ